MWVRQWPMSADAQPPAGPVARRAREERRATAGRRGWSGRRRRRRDRAAVVAGAAIAALAVAAAAAVAALVIVRVAARGPVGVGGVATALGVVGAGEAGHGGGGREHAKVEADARVLRRVFRREVRGDAAREDLRVRFLARAPSSVGVVGVEPTAFRAVRRQRCVGARGGCRGRRVGAVVNPPGVGRGPDVPESPSPSVCPSAPRTTADTPRR